MKEPHINLIIYACHLSSYLSSTLIHWNSLRNQLQVKPNQRSFKRSIFLFSLGLVLLAVGTAYASLYANLTFLDKTLQGITYVVFLMAYCFIIAAKQNASSICKYVNGVLSLTPKYLGPNTCLNSSFVTRVNTKVAYMMYLSSIVFPVAYLYGFQLLSPCNPSLVGYFLLPSCQKFEGKCLQKFSLLKLANYILKFSILLTNHWMWSFAVNTSGLVVTVVMILCTIKFGQAISG